MPLLLVPSMRVVPRTSREWDEFFRTIQVTPDDGSTGTSQLENDSVTNAKLRNSGALSVIGRSTNTTGDPADISATVAETFLVRRGTALGFGPLLDADIPSTLARDTEVAAAITTHEGLSDPHPGYTTAAELATAVSNHEGAANPHPGYLTPAEGDAAYEPLGTAAIAVAAAIPDVADDFADDAAAAVGGIGVGELYHTSGVVKLRLS